MSEIFYAATKKQWPLFKRFYEAHLNAPLGCACSSAGAEPNSSATFSHSGTVQFESGGEED